LLIFFFIKNPFLQTIKMGNRQQAGGIHMTKHTKKDGGTKQKGKGSKGNKTSGSANGSNGYH
jgi:hypothetical protein